MEEPQSRFMEPAVAVANAAVALGQKLTAGLASNAIPGAIAFKLGNPGAKSFEAFHATINCAVSGAAKALGSVHDTILEQSKSSVLARRHAVAMDREASSVGGLQGEVTSRLQSASVGEDPVSVTFAPNEIVDEVKREARDLARRSFKDITDLHAKEKVALSGLEKFVSGNATIYPAGEEPPHEAFYSVALRAAAMAGLVAIAMAAFKINNAHAEHLHNGGGGGGGGHPTFVAQTPRNAPVAVQSQQYVQRPQPQIYTNQNAAPVYVAPTYAAPTYAAPQPYYAPPLPLAAGAFGVGLATGLGLSGQVPSVNGFPIHREIRPYMPSERFVLVAKALVALKTHDALKADAGVDRVLRQARACVMSGMPDCRATFDGVAMDFLRHTSVATMQGVVIAEDVQGRYRESPIAVQQLFAETRAVVHPLPDGDSFGDVRPQANLGEDLDTPEPRSGY